jgi:hypothetical protein
MGFLTPDVVPEYKGSKQLKETVYGTTNLTDSESFNISKLFGDLLSSGADPSRVALEATTLGKEYPGLKPFRPGGRIYNELITQSFAPKTRKETIDAANRNYLSILGRGMTGEEQAYVDKERPSEQQLTSMLYANPSSNFAQAETPDEQKISAYYGRLIPRKDENTGAVGFTGERYGLKIKNPVTYTG